MTADTGVGKKDLFSGSGQRGRGSARSGLKLLIDPGMESNGRLSHDLVLHPGMCFAAVLVTVTGIGPRLIELEEDRIVYARVGIDLPLQLRCPEAVNNIR